MNDALDFSKIEVGELCVEARPVLLRTAFLEVMAVMRSAYRVPQTQAPGDVRLRLEVAQSVPAGLVLTDEARVRQVCKCSGTSVFMLFVEAFTAAFACFAQLLATGARWCICSGLLQKRARRTRSYTVVVVVAFKHVVSASRIAFLVIVVERVL